MALKKRKSNARNIEPGMNVEATPDDLGEEDVSKPKVTDVARDAQGSVVKLVVKKGGGIALRRRAGVARRNCES